jgi:uncharacterized protein (DUF3820 family)
MRQQVMTMPFGKYKGRPMYEVPKGYLKWMEHNMDLQGDLLVEVQYYLHGKPRPMPPPDVNQVVSSIEDQLSQL